MSEQCYLMTHSLLSSWLHAMKSSPYDDATMERDPYAEFLQALRREPVETTEAMQRGIDFEDLVTAIVRNDPVGMQNHPEWFDPAKIIADTVRGGLLQYRARKKIRVGGMNILLYGRLDVLKAGIIYDVKFSSGYEVGKFFDSTQHPAYLEMIPEAEKFVYLVSNGKEVFREQYRRDEVPPITTTIQNFIDWLNDSGLMPVYMEKWLAI